MEHENSSFLSEIIVWLFLIVASVLCTFIIYGNVNKDEPSKYVRIYTPSGDLLTEGEAENIEQDEGFVNIEINGTIYHVKEDLVITSSQ